jgi:hypothetical protein
MKTIAILLVGLVLAAPVQAQTTLQSKTVPAKVRYGYVYDLAQRACPFAESHSFGTGTKFAYVDRVAINARMTADERSLLFAMCDMYRRGAISPR